MCKRELKMSGSRRGADKTRRGRRHVPMFGLSTSSRSKLHALVQHPPKMSAMATVNSGVTLGVCVMIVCETSLLI